MANKINVGNPEVTTKTNILDIDLPTELENAISTGWEHFDALCAGDGMIPSTVAILTGLPGAGKCLGFNTPILMHDGTIKMVQDVVVGDKLMGPDSTPRNVISLARGKEEMFDVIPTKGDTWSCNRSHILSLVYSGTDKVKNISVNDFLKLGPASRFRHKQYRAGCISFSEQPTPLDPYYVGLWLGDGTNYIDNEKRIARNYLVNSEQTRLALLAGIVDTDGHVDRNKCLQITTKYAGLKDDILFLARSLGFAAYASSVIKTIKSRNFSGSYWQISISGDINRIPCNVERKKIGTRIQQKNVLRTGIVLESKGVGDYYGFELDGDRLFVLGDFTVTHNTTFAVQLADSITGTGNIALYNTCEESLYQVRRTVKRMDIKHGFVPSYYQEVSEITAHADNVRAENPGKQVFLFIDSLQTIECNEIDPKTRKIYSPQAQSIQAAWRLSEWAKKNYTNAIIIGQVTKDGTFAGKQEVKHAVDMHISLHLDTDRRSETYGDRVAMVEKNRFGSGGLYFPYEVTSRGIHFKD
jgi:KaiC/GvpD/RAD55 family RecA-like ATPase